MIKDGSNEKKTLEMFAGKITTDPNEFGVLDVSKMEKSPRFALILGNPYIRLDRWVNPVAMKYQCKLVIAPNVLPLTGEKSPAVDFCYKHKIPFVNCNLKNEVMNRFVKLYGCTFVNLAEAGEFPKLLLVDIPKDTMIVHIPKTDEIIGICADTVLLDHVLELQMPGNVYGWYSLDFASKCRFRKGFIEYPRQGRRKGIYKFFKVFMDEDDDLEYEET